MGVLPKVYRTRPEQHPNKTTFLLPLFFFVNPSSFKQIHPKNPETFYPDPKRSCSGIFSRLLKKQLRKNKPSVRLSPSKPSFCISKSANLQISKFAITKQLID